MYNTSNEFLIESTEISLLVTEGFADKSKKAFATVIKKIKEFIRKVLTYIKSKLNNKIKAVNNNIKRAKADKPENIDEPITLASTKKLTDLLKSIELMEKEVKNIFAAWDSDTFDELYDGLVNKYDNLKSLYENYKDDIDETYPNITPSMYDVYGEINKKCGDIVHDIESYSRIFDDKIKLISSKIEDDYDVKRINLMTKTQAVIAKSVAVTDFVTDSCNRSIRTLYNR